MGDQSDLHTKNPNFKNALSGVSIKMSVGSRNKVI